MGQLTLIVEFGIKPGRLDDFKAIGARIREATAQEPGTLRYDWYISEDGARDINIEVYADPAAYLAHGANVGPLLGELLETAGLTRLDVIGDVSDEAMDNLASMGGVAFSHIGGIGRG